MKVYFDTCCYGRPYDDNSRREVEEEANAVMTAVDVCRMVGHVIVGSTAVISEIGEIRNADKRTDVRAFFDDAIDECFNVLADEATRAQVSASQAQGLGAMDALHLAAAEAAGADILLTTDKNFVKISARIKTPVKVMNPLNFLSEAVK
jgi:predicted nucleic acid-binding protein